MVRRRAAGAGFLASFYGGIVEELELRLFFTTLLAWGLYLLSGKRRLPWQALVAVLVAALAFGAGHLPAAAQVWPLDAVVITRTVFLNAIAGLVFGWFYVRHGLESAMLSHFCADLVLHAGTKYLGGHNDLLAGAVCGDAGLVGAIRDLRGMLGGVLDGHSAYLLHRGLKTLALRVERQNASALRIAGFLEGHPEIERVFYPGLASHPDHAVAREQMRGFGGVVSFLVRGDLDRTSRFIDACKIPYIAPSLGGAESLIEMPVLMSFWDVEPAARRALGITDSLVRFSCGIEDAKDLIADVEQALRSV